jgi:glucan biosynthesis protein C
LNREHRWRATLNEAVFPVYIVHQTATVLLVVVLRPLHWAAGVEGPLLVAATFAISTAVYLFVRRVGLLRPWFGLAPARARPSRTRHAQPPRRAA